ncbi:MAG: cyclase family protein [Chloroflexi bacterium]|nr:cyclase family protein [Chloroflexota bacterium]
MRLIDLSHTITFPHWRWKPERHITSSHANGDLFTSSRLHTPLHGFTHVDAPAHFLPGARTITEMPLDQWCGPAAVVDLSHRGADDGITAADLDQHGQHIQAGDIVLLRTDWDQKTAINTREFWTTAPWTTREAAEWLAARDVRAVGYDYPPDPSLRMNPEHPGSIPRDQHVTHDVFFPRGITVIEYLANLRAIPTPRTIFMALPLKVDGGDGSPVRAVALEL